jgi:hypothetical protein
MMCAASPFRDRVTGKISSGWRRGGSAAPAGMRAILHDGALEMSPDQGGRPCSVAEEGAERRVDEVDEA